MMKMKSRFILIVLVNVGILLLILMYHERILTNLDKFLMPDSSKLCKIISDDLSKKKYVFNKIFHILKVKP